jgi:hypothetical protein
MLDKVRERALESALLLLYEAWADLPITAEHPRPYYAERFRQTIVPGCKRYKGGVQAVKDILAKREVDAMRLKCYPDLTVEYLVSSGKWNDLFNEADRTLARLRVKKLQSWTTTNGGSRANLSMWRPSDGMDEFGYGGDWDYTRRQLQANGEQSKRNPSGEGRTIMGL